ncbi:MAG: glutathione S-transferase family protein [Proteobacteria bacterium]|nr:glutathione S-transferase family protein [Pseudomonadota bacterium]
MTTADTLPVHQLLGLFDSPYVRRVAITMTHYGIPFEHVSLSVFRHMDQMRPLNPLFKVPMLTLPSGEKLYESAYQLDYLDEWAEQAGLQALTPRHGAQRREVLQKVALATIAVEKAVGLAYERRRPSALVWNEWVERLREQMKVALDQLEAMLKGEYLVGSRMSQADITTVVTLGFIRFVLPEEWPIARYPALENLAARLEATPEFLAVPIDKE